MHAPARILLSTASLYVLDLAHCFELAAATGFDGVEVMCDQRWSTRDPVYLRRLRDQYQLPIAVLHTPFSPHLPGWSHPADQLRRIEQTLALAESLAAETIVVHLPSKRRQRAFPWRAPFAPVKRWMERDLATAQQQTSVNIAIENMPAKQIYGQAVDFAWWNTLDEWRAVHRWLTLDTTHWATKRIDPLVAYTIAKSQICHVHLSNYDGREHRLPHMGDLDLGLLLRTMALDGFGGTISVEVYPEVLAFADDTALRRNLRGCLQFCREHLSQG